MTSTLPRHQSMLRAPLRTPIALLRPLLSQPFKLCRPLSPGYHLQSTLAASPNAEMDPLSSDDGPLVWIDLETTGLDSKTNRILEIAVLITNGNLDLVDEEGCHYIVKANKKALGEMDQWCLNQHTKSGLVKATLESPHTPAEVSKAVLEYITRWVPARRSAVLAGSSVHFDAGFLRALGPDVAENAGKPIWGPIMDHLHYRIVDVSTLRELCRRWYPTAAQRCKELMPQTSSHRALDDIKGSIAELKFYREALFLKQPRKITKMPN